MKKAKTWQILLFGALIGVINGFFGGGGGMVVVPLLNKMFGMEQKKSASDCTFCYSSNKLGEHYCVFN